MNNHNNYNTQNNQQNNGINIIFYSRNCKTCQNLIKLLDNEKLLSFFNLYCVDDRLDHVPPQITMVPTAIVANINKPLVAKEIFEWVQQIKFIRQNAIVDMQKKMIKDNLIKLLNNKGVVGWVDQEMTGTSDNYAYTNIDKPLSHSFFNVDDEKNSAIFTAPESKDKLSKYDQKKKIDELEQARKTQDDNYTMMHKEQQLQAILKAEQETKADEKLPRNRFRK